MLSKRQEELLKLIIEDYIKNAVPVSSKAVCDCMDVSSATVRNEMAYLEEIGLLEKTHTSSGRIPSEKGYRYYVDHIMEPKELTGEEMLKLQTLFHNQSLMLTDTIAMSMELISELTNYTSVVLGTSSKENKVSKVEVVPIDETNLVAIVITDQGHVEHRNVTLSLAVNMQEIKKTVDLINRYLIGIPIDQVPQVLEYEVKPNIGCALKQQEALYNALYHVFEDVSIASNVRLLGTSNIIKQPEFHDVDKVRDIISKFEDKELISRIKEEEKGINIYIGSENEFDDDVAIIKTKYRVNGEEGTIALIGPKRMEYDRVITLLNYIQDNIGG